ncbi:hypothetical protein BDW62DRAFT_74091 [Aspergillus aurantiobrunneus]
MMHNATGRLLRCRTPSALCQSSNLAQKRSWSATMPSLSPTSSPELDQALNRFRDELFIPHALNVNQRNLVYRQRNANKLNGHPIIVPIGKNSESYQLRSINPFSLPSRADVIRVLTLMHDTNDWSNLVTFLTGIHNGGMTLPSERWEWLVRKASVSNGLGALLMCAQQSRSTRFSLQDIGIVERLFFALHQAGQRGNFTGTAAVKVHGLANSFTLLMEAPEHAVRTAEKDPKRSPLVIGTLLELSAARALSENGTDIVPEVESYALRFLASWKDLDLSTGGKTWPALDQLLQTLVPSYNGMKLALQLDGVANNKHIASGLKTRVNECGMLIANVKKAAPTHFQEKPSSGLAQARLLHQS